MSIKIAINGFGRIGRCILRAMIENPNKYKGLEIVAINDLTPTETSAHLLKYDSVHRMFDADIKADKDSITINNKKIAYSSEKEATKLPWGKLGVDIVMECTGIFVTADKMNMHLTAGAKKVLLSAPAKSDDIKTIVYGVNEKDLNANDTLLSNGSCTTNCLAPLAKILDEKFGIVKGHMTTIHSYTGDQRLVDTYHSDLRRARSAALSMIPTTTGAAKAVGLVLPQLKGKLDGVSIRVPTPNVSFVDLSFVSKKETSVEEINKIVTEASKNMKDILTITNEELVSTDFTHNINSSIFDLSQTKVLDKNFVRVGSWYDNEWGFSNRMLDVALLWGQK
jgi:glyceraldehyde 3-phosphate dehydrogenase